MASASPSQSPKSPWSRTWPEQATTKTKQVRTAVSPSQSPWSKTSQQRAMAKTEQDMAPASPSQRPAALCPAHVHAQTWETGQQPKQWEGAAMEVRQQQRQDSHVMVSALLVVMLTMEKQRRMTRRCVRTVYPSPHSRLRVGMARRRQQAMLPRKGLAPPYSCSSNSSNSSSSLPPCLLTPPSSKHPTSTLPHS